MCIQPMLSPIEMEKKGTEQFPRKSTVADFKLCFPTIKTCFADKVQEILTISVTLRANPTRLAETCCLINAELNNLSETFTFK